ncbi:MAG: AAA family ATPase [Candidatus Moranbacteria bacterium]|nr:AAA family ATPase [Candidatus Moranbacteria bacterium]
MANQEVKNYVARQISEQAKILRLSAYDRNGQAYLKRYFYYRLDKHTRNFLATGNEPRWLMVPGLRGVGKTTILAQLFFAYQKRFNGRVLYVSLDDIANKLGSDLFAVLDAYEELLGESFSALKEDVLLLVDEVHFDPKWQSALKSLYDKSRRIFIISTGSSAIAINRTADVARRSLVEKMYPLKFTEYVMLADTVDGKPEVRFPAKLGEQIAQALFESNNAEEAYNHLRILENQVRAYWQKADILAIDRYIKYYSLPSVLTYKDDAAIYTILNSVVDRIVEKDLPTMQSFSTAVLAKIPSLLFLVASSDTRSLTAFAKDLKAIDEKTLISVFRVLEEAELLLRVYPFSLSAPKRVRKPSKYLFFASSIRAALIHLTDSRAIDTQHKGKLLEDSVGMYLYRHFSGIIGASLGFDDAQGGADFIVDAGGKRIVIETGWNKRNANQAIQSMTDAKAHYGVLVTNSSVLEHKDNVVTVPFDFFYLL